jgi:hypothetical protein
VPPSGPRSTERAECTTLMARPRLARTPVLLQFYVSLIVKPLSPSARSQ